MITAYTLEQSEKWDEIVRSFGEYDSYWLSGYVKAFKIHGDGEPILLYGETPTARGINVVMKRDVAADGRFSSKIPEGKYFDFSTPYGYGGWIVEGDDPTKLFADYYGWAKSNHIICEFVRFHPMVRNHRKCEEFYDVVKLGPVVHMELTSEEAIWENIISKNRNHIRKAIKSGIKIYNGRFPEIFEKFREIYNETMDRDEAKAYYYFGEEFYRSILEDLPQNAQVFWAEKDGQVIAASIMLAANGRMNYHLSGSLREFSSLAPVNLLLYEAARWGCANGYKTLYLGGGVGAGEDSLFTFKRAFFKGEINDYYIGKKIFDQESYEELLSLREPVDSGFFPQYRA